MINLEKYFNERFQPLDVLGTTSFGPIPRIIWRNTWAKRNPFAFFFGSLYKNRAHLSTHTAITCIGNDGYQWIIEMDNTVLQRRFIDIIDKEILLPEEYDKIENIYGGKYREAFIYSGVKLVKPEKYFTNNIRSPHVCWIGRYPTISKKQLYNGNEWLFNTYREGVPYDYLDIIALWRFTKGLKIFGSSNIYVCSELVQKAYESKGVNILKKSVIPMTPKQWQKSPIMKEVIV